MKRTVVFILLAVLVLASCSKLSDEHIAVINGKPVHVNEFYMYYPDLNINAMSPETKESYLQRMLDDYLTRYYLEEQGDLYAGESGWEVSVWKIRDLANRAYQSLIIDHVMSEKALRELYNQLKYEINVSHILIGFNENLKMHTRSREEAEALVNEIHQNLHSYNFYEFVERYSDDASKETNLGNLGWGTSGRWLTSFEEAAFRLNPGEISEPIETSFGFHIIKMNERREIPLAPFEEILPDLQGAAYTKWRDRFMERENEVFDSLLLANPVVLDDSLLTDFIGRYTRLSKNVFHSEQFTSYDILEVFDDSLIVGYIGDHPINKDWIFQFLKVINLQAPPRFSDKRSFNAFVEQNHFGFLLYRHALRTKMDLSQDYLRVLNVYLAKKAAPLFNKIYVFEKINPGKEELSAFYDEQKDNLYSNEATVRVCEILLDDSTFAVQLLNRIKAGADMGKLASEHTLRNIGKANAGMIPPVKRSQYGEMGIAAFNMKDGELAGPFKIGKHYSIIQRKEYIPQSYRGIQQVNYRLLTDYRNYHMSDKQEAQREMLRKKYHVRVNPFFTE
ncbi:MAG: peptidylprolyl isomerase [FCB group bacterium]|nr:peptidylprolyl isomerase [FCB group bacterium]